MEYPGFKDMLRRVITGDDHEGRSVAIIDGAASDLFAIPGRGGNFEIWEETLSAVLDPRDTLDRGPRATRLAPKKGTARVRWSVIEPMPEGASTALLAEEFRQGAALMGASGCIVDQSRHPCMHETETLDIVCLIEGELSLILEGAETRLSLGNVVIQRGTNHAWLAHNGPALIVTIMIDRSRNA